MKNKELKTTTQDFYVQLADKQTISRAEISIKLPFYVGDTVYAVLMGAGYISTFEVDSVVYKNGSIAFYMRNCKTNKYREYFIREIERYFFSNKESAEEHLEQRKKKPFLISSYEEK